MKRGTDTDLSKLTGNLKIFLHYSKPNIVQDKCTGTNQEEKVDCSLVVVRKLLFLWSKVNLNFCLTAHTKEESSWIQKINAKYQSINLIEESIGE